MKGNGVSYSSFDDRYTSKEMNELFLGSAKLSIWRKLWAALLEAGKELGFGVTDEQIEKIQSMTEADLDSTSYYISDNTNIILIREAFQIIEAKLLELIKVLTDFAGITKEVLVPSYINDRMEMLITVEKLAMLWMQNFTENLNELNFVASNLKIVGCPGFTNPSEIFAELVSKDGLVLGGLDFMEADAKYEEFNALLARSLGFCEGKLIPGNPMDPDDYDTIVEDSRIYPVSGLAYPRNFDFQVLNALAAIGASAYKMVQDIRLLRCDKELERLFERHRANSSAMAYRQNPMHRERFCCSLAKYLSGLSATIWDVAATQTFKSAADDFSYVSDAFRVTDAILILCIDIIGKAQTDD